ncbi:MAG TPA: diguanylate cyclase [Pyrinomonadaceae bacterium]|jgi:diguanylate cyclase (GGDEF)-like protein
MSAGIAREISRQANSREQGRVLVVTDEPGRAASFAALTQIGLAVVGVAGSAAAIVALHKSRPHVVIADTNLKGISADELTRHIVHEQEHVPLVLFGDAEATIARRHATLAAGAFDYFQLPAELSLLLARTEQLVCVRREMDRLRAEADRDYLTGLANRRRFRNALGQELERWRRYKVACSLLLVDIDFLKRVNDTHGHSAGDAVIRHVASALKELSRDNDTAARLGGEEFALLLAGATEPSALAAAERLRAAVAVQEVENVGTATVSIGVASCPSHATSERTLYAACDAALYRAKGEGRNCSVLAPALNPPAATVL